LRRRAFAAAHTPEIRRPATISGVSTRSIFQRRGRRHSQRTRRDHPQRSLSAVAAHWNAESNSCQVATRAVARAIATAQGVWTAVEGPMETPPWKPYRGLPMTLGNAAAARVRLVVWCRDCRHRPAASV